MRQNKDPLALGPHWHVDYRLEAELPEDTIVGKRFLINAAFTAVALIALYFAGMQAYLFANLNREIQDWERRIRDNRAEVADIDRMQREYTMESTKVDQVYGLVRPEFFVSEFVANLGRTRPEQMSIDLIEWNDAGVVLRGGLRERSEQATRILGSYLEVLLKDEKIGRLFQTIKLTDVDRGSGGGVLRFEIKFIPKDSK